MDMMKMNNIEIFNDTQQRIRNNEKTKNSDR